MKFTCLKTARCELHRWRMPALAGPATRPEPINQRMTETTSAQPLTTAVIRFWRASAVEPQWRGWIEHVQSGESTMFMTWQQLIAHIRRFGTMAEAP